MRIELVLMVGGVVGVIIGCLVPVNCHYTEGHNGQPGCQTDEELTKKYWRNNFDSSVYWICNERNVTGIQGKCDQELLFYPPKLQCVPFHEWIHLPLEDPPSLAALPPPSNLTKILI